MNLSRVGLALVIGAALLWSGWSHWSSTRTWCPVTTPISLAKGNKVRTEEFKINLGTTYRIQIEVANKLPAETLACLLGNESSRPSQTCTVPALNVAWILSSGGKIVSQGSSTETDGDSASSSTSTHRTIGYFNAEKGKSYRLEINVLGDTGTLDVAAPRLTVSVGGGDVESIMVASGFIGLICIAAGVMGAFLVVLHYWTKTRNVRTSEIRS